MPKKKDYSHQIGKQIKKLRLGKHLSQFELAEKAGIGISYISKIEQGNRFPSLKTTIKIAKALNVEPHELFYFKSPGFDRKNPSKKFIELISILENLPDEEINLLLELAKRMST